MESTLKRIMAGRDPHSVSIAFRRGISNGIEVCANLSGLANGNIRGEFLIESWHYFLRRMSPIGKHQLGDLAERMHARIGSAARHNRSANLERQIDGFFDPLLDRDRIQLILPTSVSSPIVSNSQGKRTSCRRIRQNARLAEFEKGKMKAGMVR